MDSPLSLKQKKEKDKNLTRNLTKNLIKKALEVFLYWLVSLLVGKVYSFLVIIYWLWVADISRIFAQTFWRHRECTISHCWWACQQTTLQKLLCIQHQGWWSSRQKMSNLQQNLEHNIISLLQVWMPTIQSSPQAVNQIQRLYSVYINKLEKYTWNYSSRKVIFLENLFFTTAKKSKLTNSLARSEK